MGGLLKTRRGTSFASIVGPVEISGFTVKTASKCAHLRKIAQRFGCDPQRMVFFDNSAYNVRDGESIYVTSCHTPEGLTWEKVVECLTDFSERETANRERHG